MITATRNIPSAFTVFQCAWCIPKSRETWIDAQGKPITPLVKPAPNQISHGICNECFEENAAKIKQDRNAMRV